MNNKLGTVEVYLCQEDRDRFDKLIEVLTPRNLLECEPIAPQTDKPEPVKETAAPAEKVQESEPQSPAPWDKDDPDLSAVTEEPHAVKYSREDVQQKVVGLAAAGKKAEVKEIVNLYAERVSAIPDDKLDEVMAKLNALEG